MGQLCNPPPPEKKTIHYVLTPITSVSKEIQSNTISKDYLANCLKGL
jgi:hypothetical protein